MSMGAVAAIIAAAAKFALDFRAQRTQSNEVSNGAFGTLGSLGNFVNNLKGDK